MSNFFTLPASQRKRKRPDEGRTRPSSKRTAAPDRSSKKSRKERDESISGSDSEDIDDEDTSRTLEREDSESSSDEEEDAAARRTKLAARYLENTRDEILAEGFDAKDIDNEILAQRMGEKLKEDTAESKGRLYRWIANDYALDNCRKLKFRNGGVVPTGVAVCFPFIYSVTRDLRISKWRLPDNYGSDHQERTQLTLVSSTRGDRKKKRDPRYQHHTAEITCVAASADGKFVATGGKDRKLIVWDADLKPLGVFSQHRDALTSLCFRRGTNQLFTASRDRTVKVWSLDELAYVETLYGHQDAIVDVAALNEEHCVTAGARDRTARYWKVAEETQLVFRGGGGGHSSSKASRNGDEDKKRKPVNFYSEGSTDRIAMIDNDTFITGSDNGQLSLWSVNKKKPVFTWPLAHGQEEQKALAEVSAEANPDPSVLPDPQPRWITALASIPYSNIFFSGSWDGHVRAWKISEDRRQIESLGALETTQSESDDASPLPGYVNGIAVFELGKNSKDGLGLVVVTGKAPRLGDWKATDGRNTSVLYHIPRHA